MELRGRAAQIADSPTLAITAKAKALKAAGEDVLGLSAGEPDFDTPDFIKEAAIAALRKGQTKYSAAAGIPELKKAIVRKFNRDNGLNYTEKQIVVSSGAKHTLYNLFRVLLGEGDEVIVPAPFWVSYPEQIDSAGGKTVVVETSQKDGFVLRPEALKAKITPRTRFLVLNSPSNPTGGIYAKADIKALAEVCLRQGIGVISDEIYEKLVYEGHTHYSIAQVSPEMQAQTLLVNGLSKAYSMTGWRLGYLAGDEKVVDAVSRLQSQSTSNPVTFVQYGAVAALDGDQAFVSKMCAEFDGRRKYMVQRLNAMRGVSCPMPLGAFYAFPNVSSYYGKSFKGVKVSGSFQFCGALLEQEKVAIVPGQPFHADGHVRLSYATSMDEIRNALDRIERFLASAK
ncbi:MAG: pyridoxal phosphate-dependent aminotransferase [Planctomycetes bacterium]|nr:pyridoxal phosphate-dependent aminotransferase [Planctomycetota bacterium]